MPRRTSIPLKTKYEVVPANRITARFSAKLMKGGKQNLADRILRQALARAEAQAGRPGLEILEAAMRNATPIIEVKPRRVGGATYQVPVEIRGDRARLRTDDSDATVRALAARDAIRGLEVAPLTLNDAFLALTRARAGATPEPEPSR